MPRPRARPVWMAIVLALLLSVVVFDAVVLAWGESPAAIARQLVAGTWGTAYGAGQVVFKATSILLAAVAAQIALRAGLFHIGIDGSIAVSALAVGAVGANLPANVPHLVAWPLLAAVGALVGAGWAMPAAVLRARFGAHEVISGIMTNKIASMLVGYLLVKGLAERASVHTRPVPPGARLTRLEHVVPWIGERLHGSAASLALVAALVVAVGWPFVARRSVFGRELAAVGASSSAAEACGVPVARRWIAALALSGAVAGIVALNDVLGYKGYAEEGGAAGVGFTGLAAALLGGESLHGGGMLLAALFFGTLSQGGLSINARIPMEIVDTLVAVVILLVAVAPRVATWLDGPPVVNTPEEG